MRVMCLMHGDKGLGHPPTPVNPLWHLLFPEPTLVSIQVILTLIPRSIVTSGVPLVPSLMPKSTSQRPAGLPVLTSQSALRLSITTFL
jgi:hypothetical protein